MSKPIVQLSLIYWGTLGQLEPFAAPFRSIGPLLQALYENLPYPGIFGINRVSESDAVTCEKGLYRHLAPTYQLRHNLTSLRKVYDIFNNITGYVIQAVTAVPSEDSAAPYRQSPLLMYVNIPIPSYRLS